MALLAIFGKDEMQYWKDLKSCYHVLEKGYNSMPVNIPGTLFHRSMRARRELARILAKIISTRRNNSSSSSDLLGSFMDEREGLSDEQIADNIIGIIFAARDTTASVLTWSLKFLSENPNILHAVTVRYPSTRDFYNENATRSRQIVITHGPSHLVACVDGLGQESEASEW